MKIKICGVTLPDDAAMIANAGADYLGLNLWPRSKRYLELERAPMIASIARSVNPQIQIVGLFVDAHADEIAEAHAAVGFDRVQLHGDESHDDVLAIGAAVRVPIWKAIPVATIRDLQDLAGWPTAIEAFLLDAPSAGRGGSGKTIDWELAAGAASGSHGRQIVLAGGLTADNVAAAIARVQPWAIDVASGVERAPGVKDEAKVRAFIANARGAKAKT
ncbi:MAG TPA: phosphoribosylanthranilate isomerase [Kofleriaceae bacterium]|nr:phosphoribosylanthranilate isomerase [Kofleriaceae bacterium]